MTSELICSTNKTTIRIEKHGSMLGPLIRKEKKKSKLGVLARVFIDPRKINRNSNRIQQATARIHLTIVLVTYLNAKANVLACPRDTDKPHVVPEHSSFTDENHHETNFHDCSIDLLE